MMKQVAIGLTLIMLLIGCSSNDNANDTNNNNRINNEIDKPQDQPDEVIETNKSVADDFTLPEEQLQKLDEGEQVKALQHFLNELGYDLEVTGTYEELTTWAITDFQLQSNKLAYTGVYNEETKLAIRDMLEDDDSIIDGHGLKRPESPNQFTDIVENPYDIVALVNKNYSLPSDYVPEDLAIPEVRFPFEGDEPKKQLRQVAATALEKLFQATNKENLGLFAQSGYRSYDRQDAIFASNVEKHGEEHANTFSARPGESEHQTGLVMDVTAQSVGFDLITEFGDTPEGIWLKDNAHKYGFIIRYEEGKETITQYQYEPWHLRYVGIEAATAIVEQDLTLEQYLGAQ